MPALVVVLIVVVVAAAVGVYLSSRGRGPAEVDFKVEGSTAHVYFETHIPEEGADQVLTALMGREAMRVFTQKADHLPLGDVRRVVAHGVKGGSPVEVTTVQIKTPAEMDHLDEPHEAAVVKPGQDAGHDPLGTLHEMDFGRGRAYQGGGDDLPPLSDELEIPAKVIEAVAGPGGSVKGMQLEAFIIGLLRASGYEVIEHGDGTKQAYKGGASTYLQFVEHLPGSYPELDEHVIDGFILKVMSSHADRGMLFTPKYGPYAIYEKERRNKKVTFMTRERLQTFVDSVAMT